MLIQIPNGFLDGPDHFNHVDIDELRGKQQNYLANQELVSGNIGHIPKILEDMILSIQTREGIKWQGKISEAIYKLPSGDLETILIKVRENTYGTRFYHGAECTHCDHKIKDLLLDLSTLKITELPVADLTTPKKIQLPKTNIEVELRPSYLKDIFDIIKIVKKNKETMITSLIPLSIKSMKMADGTVVSPVTASSVENLPVSDLIFLQDGIGDVVIEGSIDTNIEIDCPNCNKEFSMKLNCYDSNFFNPTKVSTSGNM